VQKLVETKDDCFELVHYAQQASHFAPTGKNSHSSRGHLVFVVDVVNVDGLRAHLVLCDLAGSEGESALTPEFAASVSKPTLTARRLEAGIINIGLLDLQMIFNNLITSGTLTKASGCGLRKMIKPYINTKTYISVCFCFSPAFENCRSSEATLKFAAQACKLRTTPVKAEKRICWQKLASQLQEEMKLGREKFLEQQEQLENLRYAVRDVLNQSSLTSTHFLRQKLEEYKVLDLFQQDFSENDFSETTEDGEVKKLDLEIFEVSTIKGTPLRQNTIEEQWSHQFLSECSTKSNENAVEEQWSHQLTSIELPPEEDPAACQCVVM